MFFSCCCSGDDKVECPSIATSGSFIHEVWHRGIDRDAQLGEEAGYLRHDLCPDIRIRRDIAWMAAVVTGHVDSSFSPAHTDPILLSDETAEEPFWVRAEEGYVVQIDKRNTDTQMNMELDLLEDIGLGCWKRGGLKINRFGKGLISNWNDAHPDLQVSVFDIIIEVNGASGSCELLMEEMAREPVLKLRIVRPDDFKTLQQECTYRENTTDS